MSLARDVIGGRGSGTRKSGIFISYRRSQEDNARRLHALLSTRFGEDRVFRDYASITPGEDYHNRIMNEVSKCGVMLALIGAYIPQLADLRLALSLMLIVVLLLVRPTGLFGQRHARRV